MSPCPLISLKPKTSVPGLKKAGEEALVVYLQLLCMAVKQDRNGRLMLYGNIPMDDVTIARLTYKNEKTIDACLQMLTEFHLIRQDVDGVYSGICMERKQEKNTVSKRVEKSL